MRDFIRNNKGLVSGAGAVGLAVVLFLAFGVFGVHTAFIDNEVSEGGPVFASGSETAAAPETDETSDPEPDTDGSVETPDEPEAPESDDGAESDAAAEAPEEDEAEEPAAPEVETLAAGTFVDSNIHAGSGDAVILSDGNQSFLRFEDNFATDNGPDLNVYLRASDNPDDFIDLGDLKGNIGSQNYEIPAGTDLSRFTVVDVWCVRFGVSFTEAALA